MKKFTFIMTWMVIAITLNCQEIRTLPHSQKEQLLQTMDQNILAPDSPGNILMKPGDLGNPPDKNWISQFGGDGNDVGQDIITDASGNSYVTGYFSGPVFFGTTPLTSVGYTDGFLVKISSTGNLIWIRQLSCEPYSMVRSNGITLDHLGNIFITGSFNGTILQIGTQTLVRTGVQDLFIAKYDSAGTPLMATHYGSYGSDVRQGKSIAVDSEGNCYVVDGVYHFSKFSPSGYFQWEYSNGAYFMDIKYNNYEAGAISRSMPACVSINPPDATAYDSLTLTFDPALACFQWASLVGSPHVYMHSGVTIGTQTWQYVVEYNGQGHNGQSTELFANGNGTYSIHFRPSDFYGLPPGLDVTQLCMVFNDGQWGSKDGRDFVPGSGDCMDIFAPLNTVPSEPAALYLTGYIDSDVIFGNTTLTVSGYSNAPFLARCNTSGSFIWAVQGVPIGSSYYTNYNRASSLVIDDNENIYFSGRFKSQLVFGNDTLDNPTWFNYAPYFVKCTSAGSFVWSRQGEVLTLSSSYVSPVSYPVEITVDPTGNPVISCDLLNDTIAFGNNTVGGAGWGMVKYDADGNAQWAVQKEGSPKGVYGTADNKFTYTGSAGGNCMVAQTDESAVEDWRHETLGNSGAAQVVNLELDSQGNLFVYGKTDIPDPLFGNTTGTFIAKMKPDGDTLWSIPFRGGYFSTGYGSFVSVDQEDNVCVMGNFTDTLQIGNEILVSNGYYNALFIVKINNSGNVLWLKQIGDGQDFVEGNSVATDNQNNIIASGLFYYSLTIGTFTLTDAGSGDAFLAKFDGNGNVAWATRAGGDNTEYNSYAAVDGLNNIYLTGEFCSRTITVGSQTVHLTNYDGDVALIKFTPGGQMTWFQAYGGGAVDTIRRYYCWPNAIRTDASGNCYIYGWTSKSNWYGPFLLESPYSWNFSLIKTNSNGIVQWAKIIREKYSGRHSMQIDIDGLGNCYIGGNMRDTIYFENNMVVKQGYSDLFLAKYGNTGNFIWAKFFSSNPSGRTGIPYTNNYLYGIAVYDTASLFMAGNSTYDLEVDDIILNSSNLNGFISLLGPDIPVGIPLFLQAGEGLTVYPNPAEENIYVGFNDSGSSKVSGISVEILDLSGQILSCKEFDPDSTPLWIDISSLSPGMYFILVKTGQNKIAGKFIKQ